MFKKLYRSLKASSEKKNLKERAKETFVTRIKSELDKIILKEDDLNDVTVVWSDEDAKETLRSISSDYSIDISSRVELACIGKASLNNSDQYYIHLDCYLTAETGSDHEYVDKIDAVGYSEDDVVKKFISQFNKVYSKANSKEDN